MKILLLLFTLAASKVHGLDAEAIRTISEQPHSRENLVEALKIYPGAREYKIVIQSGESVDDLKAGPEFIATEKTVEGRYIVSQSNFGGVEESVIMVVTHDKDTETFKKWILLPDGAVHASTGVADLEKRTIAWSFNVPAGDPPTNFVVIESHSDDGTEWNATVLQAGKVIAIERGVAVKTK